MLATSAVCASPANDPDAPLPTPEMRVAYTCDDGSNFTVRFRPDSADAVIESGPAKGLVLPQQITASGFDYALPTHSLRGKGATVTWTVGRKAPVQCRGKSMGSAR